MPENHARATHPVSQVLDDHCLGGLLGVHVRKGMMPFARYWEATNGTTVL